MIYTVYDHIRARHYDELESVYANMRQSLFFQYYIEEIPIEIRPTDRIAGWYGYDEPLPAPAKTAGFTTTAVVSDEEWRLLAHLREDLKIDIAFHRSHTCIDYGEVIAKGLRYYLEQVEQKLADDPTHEYDRAMQVALRSALRFGRRYEALARQMAEQSTDEAECKRLLNMAETLCRVPEYPARNFHEAIQAIWLLHNLIPMSEMGWYSISLGRMDQYLYPYYLRASEDGISESDMREDLKNLFLLLDSYSDGACTLNVGGVDLEGREQYNELSMLLLSVEKEMALRAPIFAARISPNTPDEILDQMIDFDLFRIGQPTFYGEMPCRRAVMGRGIDEATAATFSANSCMGLILAGREFANMWGNKFNMHMPLELAINGGAPIHGALKFPLATSPVPITDYDSLISAYGAYLTELLQISARLYDGVANHVAINSGSPFFSALTAGCIESGRDRAIGAEYETVTVEGMGMINTCDAIEAICTLVFDRGIYTLPQMIEAARRNYEGEEEMLRAILSCRKYGMNDARCNRIVRDVAHLLSQACVGISRGKFLYLPSLHTIDENIPYGAKLAATLDGRRAGAPINKNANPSQALRDVTPTSVILSATAFSQEEFSGGQPIDLFFEKNQFATAQSRAKIRALIRSYFELGGLQLQVNSVDIDLLERAHADPASYAHVIVRKGGYSVRFCEMSEKARLDFIEHSKRSK